MDEHGTTAAQRSLVDRADGWQRRRRWVAFPVAVVRKYAEDGAARNAARVAYYAFFSIFPLLLVFVSLLGFALEGDPALRRDILDSAFADMPVVGPFVRNDVGAIGGSGVALAVGIAVALWAGLGVTTALGQAFDDVWSVPRLREPGFVSRRLRGLVTLAVAGVGIVASSALGGAATSGRLGAAGESAAVLVLSLAVDALALMAAFRLLTAHSPGVRELVPGVVVATLGLLVLQALGGWYVSVTIERASDTYGFFATVIGLLSWLSLTAQLLLVAAEVNAVRVLRLWPRSLRGVTTPADERALERYAERARRDPGERIAVRWTRPGRRR
ncbi:MAG TPA: YihY/virulence factor BrkB family protein [Solirubrobacteraceae bacterium]|nr:YihY/virulence factor BrkB family protein [Solirubrobacteraceae bacterium]